MLQPSENKVNNSWPYRAVCEHGSTELYACIWNIHLALRISAINMRTLTNRTKKSLFAISQHYLFHSNTSSLEKKTGRGRGRKKDKGKQLAEAAWSREDWRGCGWDSQWAKKEVWRKRRLKKRGGWQSDDRKGRWESLQEEGEREEKHYAQSALTNQPHSPWPGVNVITVYRPHQRLLHAPLHLVKQMPWLLTNQSYLGPYLFTKTQKQMHSLLEHSCSFKWL